MVLFKKITNKWYWEATEDKKVLAQGGPFDNKKEAVNGCTDATVSLFSNHIGLPLSKEDISHTKKVNSPKIVLQPVKTTIKKKHVKKVVKKKTKRK